MATEPAAEAMDVEPPARQPPDASAAPTISVSPFPAAAAKHRSPHDLLAETRSSMEELAARMISLKKEGNSKAELRELLTQMSLLLITLRQVNREILMEEDRVKGETEAAKAPVDSTTLQLHNLLYEKNHYVKAIRACRDFQTKHPGIDLVPEEEFRRVAPPDIRDKSLATDGAHDLMLKRLSFELFQRKELCKLHEKLEQRKSSLLETIANQKRFLSSLPSHLKSLKKASLPVQQQLGMLHTKKLKQHHAAELLPTPLYIAYTQLLAQKEAFGEKIDVEIIGSTKDAQTFAEQQAKKENVTLSNGDNSRLDDDVIDEDDDAQRRRSRSKKNVVKEATNPAMAYQLYPLKIILHIYDTEDSGTKPLKLITLRLEYLAKLNVICVGIEDSERLGDNILCNLFPDDTGLELPHQMAKLYAVDAPNFSEKDSRPYKWAQHLAGIDFLPEVPPSVNYSNGAMRSADLSSGLALYRQQNRAQIILQRIRSRKLARMALTWQLDCLTKLNWPLIEHANTPWASHTPSCTLHCWSSTGFMPESLSHSALMVSGAAGDVDNDLDRRSVTRWEETENTREDGELPVAVPAEKMSSDSIMSQSDASYEVLDHSRGLSLISKSVMPSKRSISHSLGRTEDDLDLLMDCESELDEQICTDQGTERGRLTVDKSWEDYASREFTMVLSKTLKNDQKVMLEAKVKISMEYPLRPPLFTLQLLSEGGSQALKWHNDLRAMEAEVNLHILRILPLAYENYILAHQILCLAMLFDMHFDEDHRKGKVTSVIDVGLCKPVSGTILARSVRGRDRRKTVYWQRADCSSSHP